MVGCFVMGFSVRKKNEIERVQVLLPFSVDLLAVKMSFDMVDQVVTDPQ
jgi:hypothetical protein